MASAKLFNKHSRFFILDDVVTSLDLGHRRRLLRVIRDEFKDWQILLLTHEPLWFDMIKKELASSGWLFKEVDWDSENGVLLKPSAEDLKALIQLKRSKKDDVSNDLRRLLESTLKEISFALETRVPFRYNDQNERRTSGELLSDLKATVNRKSPGLKKHAIFPSLEGSNLVVNIGSHDNPEPISGGDVDVALNDIETLEKLFSCGSCQRYVKAQNILPGKDKIACKCGKTELDWKN